MHVEFISFKWYILITFEVKEVTSYSLFFHVWNTFNYFPCSFNWRYNFLYCMSPIISMRLSFYSRESNKAKWLMWHKSSMSHTVTILNYSISGKRFVFWIVNSFRVSILSECINFVCCIEINKNLFHIHHNLIHKLFLRPTFLKNAIQQN